MASGTSGDDPLAKPDWAMSRRERDAAARARAGLPPRRRRWPWALLALLLIGAAALGWQWRQARTADAASRAEAAAVEEPEPTRVQINRGEWAAVEPLDLRRGVEVIGTLAPARRADLAAETGGQVESVLVRPGDRVTTGQLLVQVDVERLTLDLDLARSNADATRAQLALAEGQLSRAEELVERGVAAASTLDEARTSVEGLRANLAALDDQATAAELGLRGATVRAPFAGIVSSRSVEPGAVIAAGAPLLSVVDLREVEMLAQAPVAAGAAIRPGQAVEVEVDGVAGRAFAGEVVRVAPVADEGTRTLTVYVAIDNADGTLLGGMFATGRIVVAESAGALAVPTEALREDAAGAHVLVIEDGSVVRRAVAAGEAWEGGLTEVAEGLSPGDAVVVAPLSGLEAGEPVELVEF